MSTNELRSSFLRSVWSSLLAACAGGFVIGFAMRLAEESNVPGANELGTYYGLWIVCATVLAAWSRSWQMAALRVVAFLLAMVMGYYAYTRLVWGFVPVGYMLIWVAVALFLAPCFAIVAWQSRRTSWVGALGVALPVGLLVWEAYSLRWGLLLYGNNATQIVFDTVTGMVLFVVLTKGSIQRAQALMLTLVIAFIADIGMHRILPVVLGRLQNR